MFSVSVACVKCEKIRLFSGSGFTLRNSCSRNCFAESGSPAGPVDGEEVERRLTMKLYNSHFCRENKPLYAGKCLAKSDLVIFS